MSGPRQPGPPKDLKKPASSILLNQANLSWSQPSGGVLVRPAPPAPPRPPPPFPGPVADLPNLTSPQPPPSTFTPQVSTQSNAPQTFDPNQIPYNAPTFSSAPVTPQQQAPLYSSTPTQSNQYTSNTGDVPVLPTPTYAYQTMPLPGSYQVPDQTNQYVQGDNQAYSPEQTFVEPNYAHALGALTSNSYASPTYYLPSGFPGGQEQQLANSATTPSQDYQLPTSWAGYPPNEPQASTEPVQATYYDNYYNAVQPHWFYEKRVEGAVSWTPFTLSDSINLEEAFRNTQDPNILVPTDGGRYDVDIVNRMRKPIFWDLPPTPVRRCTWFYTKEGMLPIPYEEHFSYILEELYKEAFSTGKWNQKVELPNNEYIIFYNTESIMHFTYDPIVDEWTGESNNPFKAQIVRRGTQDYELVDGEPAQVDHLIFFVHGVGSVCDFKFRSIVEVVDDLRTMSQRLARSHFKALHDQGNIGRVEYLPVSWHTALHGDETGIDNRLEQITLPSIPKLRAFSNDTILDALFYTSPVYAQTIVDAVGTEMNRLFGLFQSRNPSFHGSVALSGHSLGSLIIFDILSHQRPGLGANSDEGYLSQQLDGMSLSPTVSLESIKDIASLCSAVGIEELLPRLDAEKIDLDSFLTLSDNELIELGVQLGPRKKLTSLRNKSPNVSTSASPNEPTNPDLDRQASVAAVPYNIVQHGLGQPTIKYPQLSFSPSCFFAFGSPIAMFLTVRGIKSLDGSFHLPTCHSLFNIFHPYDPIAYRIEPMIDPSFTDIKPVLVPHHKGRKRMHLEIRENLADFKQKVFDSFKSAWGSMTDFARAHRSPVDAQPSDSEVNAQVDKVVNEEMRKEREGDFDSSCAPDGSQVGENIPIGQLNNGRRIDYVLQEKPIEMFNEYLFALAAHACYWESEDTALLMIKEVYATQGVFAARERTDSVLN